MLDRRAWTMTLKPGNEALYKKRHDEIWPELQDMMQELGIKTFAIYRRGLTLFAYQERDASIPEPDTPPPIAWKWWESMAPLMETNDDTSPVTVPLEEVFIFTGEAP